MATVSSLGIGSGIDLQSMLTKILESERAPISTLETKISSYKTQISLYGTIKSKLSALQTAAQTLQFPSRLGAVSATPADATVISATASASAPKGSYSVTVTQLAAAQKTITTAVPQGWTASAADTLSFTFGATTTNVAVASGDTLTQIAASVNSAGIGVTASVVSGVDGDHLMLSGTNTGSANSFTFSFGTTGLAEDAGLAVVAQDGVMEVAGIQISSSTNTFATQFPGVTFTALKQGATTVNVQTDNTKVVTAMQAFVDAYNAVVSEIKKDTAFDTTNKTAQPLTGDTAARAILSTLSATRTTTPSSLATSTVQTLAALGVTVKQDGQLSLDSTKLTASLSASPTDAMSAVNAFGKAFGDAVTGLLDSTGTIENRISNLNGKIKRAETSQASLEARVSLIEAQYVKQFNSLDSLVNKYKSTSTYLTQQFAAFSSSSS